MKVTIDYVKQKFQEFNELCFEGKLKPLPFRVVAARSFLGEVTYHKEKNPDGTWHYYGFIFKISTVIDMPENEIDDVILHEMIHYYIFSNQIQDTSPHGEVFTTMMKDINVRFNRSITVSHKTTKEEQDKDTEVRQHIICSIRLRNNQRGVTVATKSSVFKLWDEISNNPNVAECNWYLTTDPFFNRFPRANTLKVYPVQASELEEHLEGASPLIKVGNYIKVKK